MASCRSAKKELSIGVAAASERRGVDAWRGTFPRTMLPCGITTCEQQNADYMVPLRDSPETRSSCSRAFARPAPGCRSASSRPAASTARYCTSTSPVLAQSRPRRLLCLRRKSVRGLGASRACSKRRAHRATQAHECTPARAIADLILQTQSASRDNLAGLRSIDILCLPRAAFQRPVGR